MASAVVTLREVTNANLYDVLRLRVAEDQRGFVAPNANSIAEAYFCPEAWFRAIYADETPVGFAMLYIDTEKPDYMLWRFMIDQAHQGRGYGRAALDQIIEYVKTLPRAICLDLSYVEGEKGPEGFYRKSGFVATGEMDGDEYVMRLDFSPSADA